MKELKKGIPTFELLVTFYLIYLTILFSFYPDLLASDRSHFYENVAAILPPASWAYVVFLVSMISSIGLIFNRIALRAASLVMFGIIFTLFSIAFFKSFPNMSFGIYALLAVFSFVSIVQVNRTEL